MSEGAAKHIGMGIAWFGFWLMIGLANFGEDTCTKDVSGILINKAAETVLSDE